MKAHDEKMQLEFIDEEIGTYLVPIFHKNGYQINMTMIDEVIDFVKCDLVNFCLVDST